MNSLVKRLRRLEARRRSNPLPPITHIEVCHYDSDGALIVVERIGLRRTDANTSKA
jgi:hypothetical protein